MIKKSLVLLLVLTILLAGCGTQSGGGGATPTPFPTPVKETFTAQRGDITVEAKLSGHVSPLALYTVYFQINGQVSEVYANVNDVVEKGQLLGELVEARDLKATSMETTHKLRRAQIKMEMATLTLDEMKLRGRPPYDIKMQELEVELAQMELDEILVELGVDPDETAVDELEAEVAKAQAFAPETGTIISSVSAGRNVTSTTPAFVLGDPNKLEVIAELDPITGGEEVKEMFEGMPVTVTIDADTDIKLTGTIRQLPSPYGTGASDDKQVHVLLDVAPSASTYQLGDKVTVTIQLASKQDVVWLPPDAIRNAGGRTFVIINTESGPKRVDVEIGLETREMVEIVSGLDEGQVVVGP
jgi:multidrug efflux pump subunit AcrA (membrane-fusion protein)